MSSTILVVDDDDGIREALAELLEYEGYSTAMASNGAQALIKLREGEPPRLILLDLMMPVMNGYEFLKARQEDAQLSLIPVLVLTAGGPASGLGDTEVLAKPVDLERLLARIDHLCAPPRPDRRLT